jgi:predicted  nucleic acid-binding Zn-ribbon protein
MAATRVDLGRFRRKVEADLAQVHKTQDQHSRLLTALTGEVSTLKSDVSTLKTDMAEVKDSIKEILRRLPPLSADG